METLEDENNHSDREMYPKRHLCPACGRFVGPLDVCPYCDTDTVSAPLRRIVRQLALILAVSGVALLLLVHQNNQVKTVNICEISPTMNFAVVRVQGEVDRAPYLGRKKEGQKIDYLSFRLLSGTNYVRVVAYGDTAEKVYLKRLGLKKGVFVEVVGRLSIDARNEPRLRILKPDHINICTNLPIKPD